MYYTDARLDINLTDARLDINLTDARLILTHRRASDRNTPTRVCASSLGYTLGWCTYPGGVPLRVFLTVIHRYSLF